MEIYTRAAKASHAEATAEENRAENKYDTRGLEASYLATGQANKVLELEAAIEAFSDLKSKSTFALLSQIFSLQAKKIKGKVPILTLPLSLIHI